MGVFSILFKLGRTKINSFVFSSCTLAIVCISSFNSCTKSRGTIPDDLSLIKGFIQTNLAKNKVGKANRRSVHNGASIGPISVRLELAPEDVDIYSTEEVYQFADEEANTSYHVYATDFASHSNLSGGIMTILFPNQRVISYISIVDNISGNDFTNTVYSLDGEEIASFEYSNDSVSGTKYPVYVTENSIAEEVRSWFSCTMECSRETVLVCAGDPRCFRMFMVSNLPNGKVAGMGSLSIGLACSYMCLKNRNFDVLPSVGDPRIVPLNE